VLPLGLPAGVLMLPAAGLLTLPVAALAGGLVAVTGGLVDGPGFAAAGELAGEGDRHAGGVASARRLWMLEGLSPPPAEDATGVPPPSVPPPPRVP